MTRGIRKYRRRSLRRDRRGGIEGLPLEMMVILVVAALGTAVLVGWFNGLDDPQDDKPAAIGDVKLKYTNAMAAKGAANQLEVYVYDTNGDPVQDASVLVTGCEVTLGQNGTPVLRTSDRGGCKFSDLRFTLPSGQDYGYATVHVSSSDCGQKSVSLMVVG